MFHHLKSEEEGVLVRPESFRQQKENLEADNYVDLYDDGRLTSAINLSCFGKAGLDEIKQDIEKKDFEAVFANLNEMFDNFLIKANEFLKKLEDDTDSVNDQDKKKARTNG